MDPAHFIASTSRSWSPRVLALAMIVGLVMGMAALVAVIILLEDDGTSAADNDQRSAVDQPRASDQPTDTGQPGGTEQDPTTNPVTGWPTIVEFRPSVLGEPGSAPDSNPDLPPGLYLWSDFEGWHLWSVGPNSKPIDGSVVVDGALGAATTEVGGAVVDEIDDGRIEFRMAGDGVSGVRFNPGFFTNRIEIRIDGDAVPVALLGNGAVSTPLPMAIEKNQPIATLED